MLNIEIAVTIGLQIAILCSDNEGTWGFSRYSFNGFHTRQQTDQRSLMISANQLQQSGSSGNPTSFDDHFLLQNHPMPSNSELRSNLLAALQSTTITPLALASNIETVGDIDTPNVHHGAIRTRQTQDTIRKWHQFKCLKCANCRSILQAASARNKQ
jgi:hypothetical protein